MCECDGTGTVEEYVFGLGMRDTSCPDDNCSYWEGE